jgi:DnaJ-domain-containing protein 1
MKALAVPIQQGSVLDRTIHTSVQSESAMIAVAGISVGVAALAARYGLEAYEAWQKRPASQRTNNMRRFYKGGFEDDMTRREAALILGVRESTSKERVQARYRKLLILNHPDTGGSTYLAAKINEAKDIMMGKKEAAK